MLQQPHIPGFYYHPDLLTEDEQQALKQKIDQQSWQTSLKRRVQQYGYRYDYNKRGLSSDDDIGALPEWLMPWIKYVQERGLIQYFPDQLIINEYQPGQGIALHKDIATGFGEEIWTLSIGGGCIMRFVNSARDKAYNQYIAPGSFYKLTGPARYKWKHGIAARKTDRINNRRIPRNRRLSLTFRTVH